MRISDWSSDVCSSDLGLEAADAGADHHAGAPAVLVAGRRPAGILDRLLGRRHAEYDEAVELAFVARLEKVVRVEQALRALTQRHLAGDLRGQVRNVEALDTAYAGFAVDEAIPEIGRAHV